MVTWTAAEVVVLFAASLAIATTVYVPSANAAVLRSMRYGATESIPIDVLFTLNSTLVTPTLSDETAEIGTIPESRAPLGGEVRVAIGAVTSLALPRVI